MRSEETIKSVISHHLTAMHLEKIVLFGSQARGNAKPTSDYDILIVLNSELSTSDKMVISAKLRSELARLMIDADIVIKSNSEVAYYKDKIGSVVHYALKEGVVL